jgi:hypothetical protein
MARRAYGQGGGADPNLVKNPTKLRYCRDADILEYPN